MTPTSEKAAENWVKEQDRLEAGQWVWLGESRKEAFLAGHRSRDAEVSSLRSENERLREALKWAKHQIENDCTWEDTDPRIELIRKIKAALEAK